MSNSIVFETLKIDNTFDNEIRIYNYNEYNKESYIIKLSIYSVRLKEIF